MKPKIKQAIVDIIWMARRYAHDRDTYVAGMFNDTYDILRNELKFKEKEDSTIETFPYAKDHSVDVISGRKYVLPKL